MTASELGLWYFATIDLVTMLAVFATSPSIQLHCDFSRVALTVALGGFSAPCTLRGIRGALEWATESTVSLFGVTRYWSSAATRLFGNTHEARVACATTARYIAILRCAILPVALIPRFSSEDIQRFGCKHSRESFQVLRILVNRPNEKTTQA